MKKILLSFMVLTLVSVCTGCGRQKPQVRVFNAVDYIDDSVRKDFEKEFGIEVVYTTFINDEAMYNKVRENPDSYDVVIPSDYMISRMLKEDMLAPLDMNQIPNYTLIDSQYKNMPFDPSNRYSVPYMVGTLGILYNKDLVVEPITSWESLWDNRYTRQILVRDSERDAIAIGLKAAGFGMNSANENEITMAKQKLLEQRGRNRAYQTYEIKDNMVNGMAAIAVTYSGDAFYAMQKAANLEYVVPKEGSNKWVDGMVVLKNAKNYNEAMKFIDYMCKAESAVRNQQTTGYTSPQKEVKAKLPAEWQNSPVMYPSKQILDNCQYYEYNPLVKDLYSKTWLQVRATR